MLKEKQNKDDDALEIYLREIIILTYLTWTI